MIRCQDERDFLEVLEPQTGNPARYFRCLYLEGSDSLVHYLHIQGLTIASRSCFDVFPVWSRDKRRIYCPLLTQPV